MKRFFFYTIADDVGLYFATVAEALGAAVTDALSPTVQSLPYDSETIVYERNPQPESRFVTEYQKALYVVHATRDGRITIINY